MMRLSTAIRIGSMTTRQIKGQLMDNHNGRCALGAALDAMGYDFYRESFLSLPEAFKGIAPWASGHFLRAITNLNDNQFWTRERIADWVERVENLRERVANRKQEEAPCH